MDLRADPIVAFSLTVSESGSPTRQLYVAHPFGQRFLNPAGAGVSMEEKALLERNARAGNAVADRDKPKDPSKRRSDEDPLARLGMWRIPTPKDESVSETNAEAPPAAARSVGAQAPDEAQSGEFTGLFSAPTDEGEREREPIPGERESGSGEFTGLFQSGPIQLPSEANEAKDSEPKPAEETRRIERPSDSAEPSASSAAPHGVTDGDMPTRTTMAPFAAPPPAEKPEAVAPPVEEAHEFTQMFQTGSGRLATEPEIPAAQPPAEPQAAAAPPKEPAPPGEFTRLISTHEMKRDTPTAPASEAKETAAPERPKTPARPETAPPLEAAPQKEPPAPPPSTEAGEFTRMFRSGEQSLPTQAPMPSAGSASAGTSSEFTSLFQTPSAEDPKKPAEPEPETLTQVFRPGGPKFTPPSVTPATSAPRPPFAAPTPDAGEFTQMFQAGGQSLPTQSDMPAARPPPASSGEPGEFTGLFHPPPPEQSKTGAESRPETLTQVFQPGGPKLTRPASRPEPAPQTPQSGGEGEFTRFFQSPMGTGSLAGKDLSKSAPPAARSEPKQAQGEYTRLFKAPAPAPEAPASGGATRMFSTDAPVETAAIPASEAGPSEFTRVIRASGAPADSGAAAVPTSAPEEPARRPRSGIPIWLIIVLAVLVLSAIGLVLYFALKP